MNYYSILKISENANIEEIKKAFRKELKKHHPDIQNTKQAPHNSHTLLNIINAYTVLVNPIKRKHYDAHYKEHAYSQDSNGRNTQYKPFDYEAFLLKRQHEWRYKVKLFIYDLLFSNAKRAIHIYEYVKRNTLISKFKKTLGYYDYFDCMFLLAEAYQKKKGIVNSEKALEIYYEIGILEQESPYFKTYMEEVATQVLDIIATYYHTLNKMIVSQLLQCMLAWNILKKQKKEIVKIMNLQKVE